VGIESNQSTPEFDEFVASGDVEVGKPAGGEEGAEEKEKPKTPARHRSPLPPPRNRQKRRLAMTMTTIRGPNEGRRR
jgi:hypothetical protein